GVGVIGNKPGNGQLEMRYQSARMEQADDPSNSDTNYERSDQRPFHRQSPFLRRHNWIVRLHHQFAQKFIRGIDSLSIKHKLFSTGVFLNQIQSKLVVLKQMG